MTPDAELLAVKRRLSPSLLKISGVSGVGLPRGVLTVYLIEDSEPVRQAVERVVASEAPDTTFDYVETGRLRAQGVSA